MADIGESNLPNALPWDCMPATTYTKFNSLPPVLPMLRETLAHIAADPGFRLVREELAMADKHEEVSITFIVW